MEQRTEFALKAMGTVNFAELCREYGISTKTGYKWKERLLEFGLAGMNEKSRRPSKHPKELSEAVVCQIVRLKQAHLFWGPRKIRILYQRQYGGKLPSVSSFKRVLARAGLTVTRRVRRVVDTGRVTSDLKAEGPNDVWTVDFKGWWLDPQGQRVEPLTVRDAYSRMLLEMRCLENARTETVHACFERLFERYGLPKAIHNDNGVPFACTHGLLGLTRLSAWWLVLGIELDRSRPACPQDNGAHERMHRDVRRELEAGRAGRDQAAFDLWRDQYNSQRPHEALAMKVPAQLYRPSKRVYEGTPDDVDYGGMQTRRVQLRGAITYGNHSILISSALAGWSVGLRGCDNDLVEVLFCKLLLGHIDPATASFKPALPREKKKTSG